MEYSLKVSGYVQSAVVLIIACAMLITGYFVDPYSKAAATSLLAYAVSLVFHFGMDDNNITVVLLWLSGICLVGTTLVKIWV